MTATKGEQGQRLEQCRLYLHLLARLHLDGRLRTKLDASDLVRQALLNYPERKRRAALQTRIHDE